MSIRTEAARLQEVVFTDLSNQQKNQICACDRKIKTFARESFFAHVGPDRSLHLGCESCWSGRPITPVVANFRVVAMKTKCLGCDTEVDVSRLVPNYVRKKNTELRWKQRKLPIQILQSVVRVPFTLIAGMCTTVFSWYLQGFPQEAVRLGGMRGAAGILTAQLADPREKTLKATPAKELEASHDRASAKMIAGAVGGCVEEIAKRCLQVIPGQLPLPIFPAFGAAALGGAAASAMNGLQSGSSASELVVRTSHGVFAGITLSIGSEVLLPAVRYALQGSISPDAAAIIAPSVTLLTVYVAHETSSFLSEWMFNKPDLD